MYLTKLFFNVVSCYATIEKNDHIEGNNLSRDTSFNVACGLDEKLINESYYIKKSFKCHSTKNFLDLKQNMSVGCKHYDGINYQCTYNHFEVKEGCHSLPELCEIAYLHCLNHTTIEILNEITTTKKSLNSLTYGPEIEQINFSTQKKGFFNKQNEQAEKTNVHVTTTIMPSNETTLLGTIPNILENTKKSESTNNSYHIPSITINNESFVKNNFSKYVYCLVIFIIFLSIFLICCIYWRKRFTNKKESYELM
uniref:SUEL-type lectin domain-containing protein n=1 Tax=Strongyloides stercoralis TaxID=6248 RepID=A0A0K0ERB6_STRER